MSIAVALVIEPRLDLSVFTRAAESLTGENCVREVDCSPGRSPLHDFVRVLENFTEVGHAAQLAHVGFLVAGPVYQMNQFLELSGRLVHIGARNVAPDARGVLLLGSLEEWKSAVVWACSMKKTESCEPAVRKAYNDVLRVLTQRGFGYLFKEYTTLDNNDGTQILRLK